MCTVARISIGIAVVLGVSLAASWAIGWLIFYGSKDCDWEGD